VLFLKEPPQLSRNLKILKSCSLLLKRKKRKEKKKKEEEDLIPLMFILDTSFSSVSRVVRLSSLVWPIEFLV